MYQIKRAYKKVQTGTKKNPLRPWQNMPHLAWKPGLGEDIAPKAARPFKCHFVYAALSGAHNHLSLRQRSLNQLPLAFPPKQTHTGKTRGKGLVSLSVKRHLRGNSPKMQVRLGGEN